MGGLSKVGAGVRGLPPVGVSEALSPQVFSDSIEIPMEKNLDSYLELGFVHIQIPSEREMKQEVGAQL
jgi:hypothetical protein